MANEGYGGSFKTIAILYTMSYELGMSYEGSFPSPIYIILYIYTYCIMGYGGNFSNNTIAIAIYCGATLSYVKM